MSSKLRPSTNTSWFAHNTRRRSRHAAVTFGCITGLLLTGLTDSGGAATPAGAYSLNPPNIQVAETDAGTPTIVVSVALNRPNRTGRTLEMHYWECLGYTFCHTTAEPGVDYDSFAPPNAPRVLRFRPGQQVATIEVTLHGDTDIEPSEVLDIRFDDASGPWNLPVAWDNNAELLIGNDD